MGELLIMKTLLENWRRFLKEAAEEIEIEVSETDPESTSIELDEELGEKLKNSIKNEINAVLIDYEARARKKVSESKNLKEDSSPIESTVSTLDVDSFTNDVARLIMNYGSLLDIEAIIIEQTYEFLEKYYEKEMAAQFIEKLKDNFGISLDSVQDPSPDHIAAGATSSGA